MKNFPVRPLVPRRKTPGQLNPTNKQIATNKIIYVAGLGVEFLKENFANLCKFQLFLSFMKLSFPHSC